LWERFPTAMNSSALPANIVVKNHSHKILKLLSGSIKFVVLPFSKGELEGISSSIKLTAFGCQRHR
jgi:hypothetical protein